MLYLRFTSADECCMLTARRCYYFELMTPESRVVVPVVEPRIVLLGARDLDTLNELFPEDVANEIGWQTVTPVDLATDAAVPAAQDSGGCGTTGGGNGEVLLRAVKKEAAKLSCTVAEGYVLVDASFHRLKVKAPAYVAAALLPRPNWGWDRACGAGLDELHRMNDAHVVRLIQQGEMDEFCVYFSEWKERFLHWKGETETLKRLVGIHIQDSDGYTGSKKKQGGAPLLPLERKIRELRSLPRSLKHSLLQHVKQQPLVDGTSYSMANLPLPRSMVTCGSNATVSGTPALRVVTYNILAQTYFAKNPRQQASCPPHQRGQKARHAILMHELDCIIGAVGSDTNASGTAVICLQEVETSYFDSLLRPDLVSRGYETLYLQKNGGKVDGIAIAWRGEAQLVGHQKIDLDQAVLDAAAAPKAGNAGIRLPAGSGSERLAWSELTNPKPLALPYAPGSVALLAKLHNPRTGAKVAVGTIHVYWDYERRDIQTLQALIAADALLAMAAAGAGAECHSCAPALLCGDFNAPPQTALYALLRNGWLSVRRMVHHVATCPLNYLSRIYLSLSVFTVRRHCDADHFVRCRANSSTRSDIRQGEQLPL